MKEERERRNRLIKAESDIEQDDSKEAFKSRIRERWEMSNYAGKRANSSNFRLIVIIMALMGIAYFLLK